MKRLLTFIFLAAILPLRADVAGVIAQGDACDRKYQPDQALKFYQQAEKEQPENASLLVKIARQHIYRMNSLGTDAEKLVEGKTALAYSEHAVKLAPKECDPHLSVAICLGKITPFLGNRESVEASRRIKQSADIAVKLDPQNDLAWHILGRWNQTLANLGSGKRLIAKIVYGEIPAASNDEAIRCFQKAISLKPNRLIHSIELGRTYAQMGNPNEARKWINKGLAMPNQDFDDPETKQRGRQTLADL